MKIDMPMNRSRALQLIVVVVVIVFGLASRKFAYMLPALLKKNAGDILWATMVFFIVGLLLPRLSTLRVAAITALFSIFIEFFKLVHAPAVDALRAIVIGRLIFGYGFSWSNLVCYGLGILIGMLLEVSWRGKREKGRGKRDQGSPRIQ